MTNDIYFSGVDRRKDRKVQAYLIVSEYVPGVQTNFKPLLKLSISNWSWYIHW